MTDTSQTNIDQMKAGPTRLIDAERKKRTAKRFASERRFKALGLGSVLLAAAFLVWLLWTVVGNAIPSFTSNSIKLPVDLTADKYTVEKISTTNFRSAVNKALYEVFPDVKGRKDRKALRKILSAGAAVSLRWDLEDNPHLIGKKSDIWIGVSDTADLYYKGLMGDVSRPESERKITDKEIAWLDQLKEAGLVKSGFNTALFTNGASREPEMAGIWGAVVGSFLTLIVTLALSFPIGVAAAIYLEEFAPKTRLTDLIEVNINNLAAVPSIVFGLLGLGIFISGVDLGFIQIGGGAPRSAAVTGGLVLALMTLPTIIIAARAALKSVPPSIREAALGVGASHIQAVFHHTLPLAMPGILTGAIIGMARALGETAPLLMIGMVAFIVDIPGSFTDPATVLPVQIYMWADFPEIAFRQKTAAATLILLGFLVLMNALAVFLRSKFERRW